MSLILWSIRPKRPPTPTSQNSAKGCGCSGGVAGASANSRGLRSQRFTSVRAIDAQLNERHPDAAWWRVASLDGASRSVQARSAAPLDDDVSPCAGDNGLDLRLLGSRDRELVERLRHVIHERVPLAWRDAQVLV
jgi:hypothetical protein